MVASRPELHDNGTEIPSQPEYFNQGASRAINPEEGLKDWNFEPKRPQGKDYNDLIDDMMGAEW